MSEKKKIIEILTSKIDFLKAEYSVSSIALFGSFSREEDQKESDVDILVEFSKIPGLINFFSLQDHLSSLLGRKVDLVTSSALNPVIKDEILEEAIYL